MNTFIGIVAGVLITLFLWGIVSYTSDTAGGCPAPAPHATSTPSADVPDEALIIPRTYDAPPPPTETVIIYNPTSTERVIERETRIEERETNNTETVREVDEEPEDNGGIISEVLDIL